MVGAHDTNLGPGVAGEARVQLVQPQARCAEKSLGPSLGVHTSESSLPRMDSKMVVIAFMAENSFCSYEVLLIRSDQSSGQCTG